MDFGNLQATKDSLHVGFSLPCPIFEKACLSFAQLWTIFIYFQCFRHDRTINKDYILVTSSDFFTLTIQIHLATWSGFPFSRYDNGDRITKAEVWNLWTVTLEMNWKNFKVLKWTETTLNLWNCCWTHVIPCHVISFSHPAAVMKFILHQVCWFRLSGPMERHLALGGKADTEKSLLKIKK